MVEEKLNMADIKEKDDCYTTNNRLGTSFFNLTKQACIHYITVSKPYQSINNSKYKNKGS